MVEEELLDLVLEKRELQGIQRGYAKTILENWLEENQKVAQVYKKDPERFQRKKAFQKLRKAVRKQLREVYGVFFTSNYTNKREEYIHELIKTDSESARQEALSLHRSTKERLHQYPLLYQQLFENLPQPPTSILDLGCGFNPFSYDYLPCSPDYHCADIACDDLTLIQEYLAKKPIRSSTHCVNLANPSIIKQLPKTDVIFAFKLFDSLETHTRYVTEELLEVLQGRTLIASFPTKSIGQRKEIGPRKWFIELITDKLVDTVTLDNEQFFIITI